MTTRTEEHGQRQEFSRGYRRGAEDYAAGHVNAYLNGDLLHELAEYTVGYSEGRLDASNGSYDGDSSRAWARTYGEACRRSQEQFTA